MEYTHILVRYGEIFLKGKNKYIFENKLISNIEKITGKKIRKLRSRLVMDFFVDHGKLRRVFGLVSYSPAVRVGKDVEEIKKAALELVRGRKGKFRVETNRADKTFPIKSPDFNPLIGKFVGETLGIEGDYKNPDYILNIEINQEGAFIFVDNIKCFGGLPTGVEGQVLLLIEDEASILAGLLFMKRGCSVTPIALSSIDISLLQQFSPHKLELNLIDNLKGVETFSVDVMVIGQNFESYKKIDTSKLLFRPLIAYSEREIKESIKLFDTVHKKD